MRSYSNAWINCASVLPAVAELDLNPVLALPDRCVAVDARVRVRRPETVARTKSW